MSYKDNLVKELEEKHGHLYRSHSIEKNICKKCNKNIWSETFPEYCEGEILNVSINNVVTQEQIFTLNAALYKDKSIMNIELYKGMHDYNLNVVVTKEQLSDLISSLEALKKMFG